ncbi:MAG TPA: L-lactate permease, partial [Rhizomicrobium sp.]|nr:L-lactate permease [Rhizomicrobium sp.]
MDAWQQVYDPFNNKILSTAVAAIPIVLLLLMIATNKVKAYWAAAIALVLTLVIAVHFFTMPAAMAAKSATLGAVNGFWTIGWIILNVLFLYRLTVEKGLFAVFQHSLGRVTADRRLQLLLIPFCFGAFFEGAAGFGTPVAVGSAMLMGLGFSPLTSAAMALFANTATVAFGALGAPINGLSASTGIDPITLGKAIGIQSIPFSIIIPFYMLWIFCGWKKTWEVWPAVMVAALSFTIPQFLISYYSNPYIVDITSGGISMASLALFLRVWKPAVVMTNPAMRFADNSHSDVKPPAPLEELPTGGQIFRAWLPWVILCCVLAFWATGFWKALGNSWFNPIYHVPGLDKMILAVPPVVTKVTPQAGVFSWQILTYSGSGVLFSGMIAGLLMGFSPIALVKRWFQTVHAVRHPLLTITLMLSLASLTGSSGIQGTLGLAFAATGKLFPFFSAVLGWLGVAATGSDTSANVLFGGLQVVAAHQAGFSPLLMAAANSTGGCMGKIIAVAS